MKLCAGSVDTESVCEEKEPKKSELSKLFIGTAANGSTVWVDIVLDSEGLISGWTACSEAAKKSTAGETAELAGGEAKRSAFACKRCPKSYHLAYPQKH